jgi:hypothetical protein
MIILCAHCQLPLQFSDTTVQAANCPRCGTTMSNQVTPLMVTSVTTATSPTTGQQSGLSEVGIPSVRGLSRRLSQRSNSVLDLFDFEFVKFTTPWLLPRIWFACLLYALFGFLGYVLYMVIGSSIFFSFFHAPTIRAKNAFEFKNPTDFRSNSTTIELTPFQPINSNSRDAWTVIVFVSIATVTALFASYTSYISLLCMRLCLETVVSVIDGSEHVRTIRQELLRKQ